MMANPEGSLSFDFIDIEIALGYPDLDMTTAIIKRVPLSPGRMVLEAGCGIGKLGMNIGVRTGCAVFLVDSDREQLVRSNRLFQASSAILGFPPKIVIERADILKLPYNSDMFDLVFNEGVIEHFRDPKVPLNEMVRVSRDYVCCIVPNAKNEKQVRLAKQQVEHYKDRPDHWASYEKPMTNEEITGYFTSVGLTDMHGTLAFPDKIPPKSRDDYRMLIMIGRKPH